MFNEILEGGFNQVITQRLGMKGGAAAPAVAPEIFPTMAIEVDRPEWGWLKGEARVARYVTVPATVGEFSCAQFYVPGDRDVIAVMDLIETVEGDVLVGRLQGISGGVGPWTPEVTNAIDFRWPPQGSGLLVEKFSGAEPLNNGYFAYLRTTARQYKTPIVITPNTSLVVLTATTNAVLRLNCSWYERNPMPGELV